MKKLAFLLAASLVLNLTAPAAVTYAMPQDAESMEEVLIQETPEGNDDVQMMTVSENEELQQDVINDETSDKQKEEERYSQYIEYVEKFNHEHGGELYQDSAESGEISTDSETMQWDFLLLSDNLISEEEVVSYIRQQMVAHETTISFSMPLEVMTDDNFLNDVVIKAMAYSDECSGQEGDALYWSCSILPGSGAKISGNNVVVTYLLDYLTTAQQEELLTEKVNQIMSELNFSNSTGEYDKVKAIHDYICDNVDYDYNYKKYSAYDALCTGTAVCEGYALAFYRLCKEAGLSVRTISGIGQGGAHAWNIVRIGDVYYNVDCTWDGQDSETEHSWFLLNELDFVSHTRSEQYDTDEFHQAYPMSEYSYGKTQEPGLNLTNFNYSFNTLEETTVSGTANGKPKLLIFFGAFCYNSQYTIRDLAGCELSGVDIYAIEGNKNSKETVQEFKDNYGDDSIVFSYDASERNNRNNIALWAYAGAGGYERVTYPLICYIDGNNKLQYITSGISSGAQIISNLKLKCGYVEQYKEYTITYHLDGGNNHPDNPAAFRSSTKTITLQEPNKTGYAFQGWYTEPEFKNKITKISTGTRENITLYAKFVKELELTIPEKTTYLIGEEIDPAGGKVVHNASGESADITSAMISGFDSTKEGVCTVTVTYQKCKTTYEVLIIKVPEVEAQYGQSLETIVWPEYQYGTFSSKDKNAILNAVGEYIDTLTFQPKDEKFSVRNDIEGKVLVYRSLEGEGIICEAIKNVDFIYNGYSHTPEIIVYADGKPLTTQDYIIHYSENINAGVAYYWIEGQNFYTGSKSGSFVIKKADLVITAKDIFLEIGSEMPTVWEYEIDGLVKGDTLVTEPKITVTVEDTQKAGRYQIIPTGAAASENYNEIITYVNGNLMIAEEKVGYEVSFDLQGHGMAIPEYFGIKAGDVIENPETPTAEGYEFCGWYKDANYKKLWNFATDTVQSDIVLYAKWVEVKNNFRINEIKDVVYNGKKLQPLVEVYDGENLLKAKKDYKITYHNNVNVNTTPAGDIFNEELPYVTITGIGNYADTIKLNFNIVPAVIGDGTHTPADSIVLSYSDQLTVDNKKARNPFKSIKLGRSLKQEIDYTVSLVAVNVKDLNGKTITGELKDGCIPSGSSGNFELKITGTGNYTGSITKDIFVAEKSQLLKNAKIILGKNLKTMDFDTYNKERNSRLPAAYYDSAAKKYYAVENGSINYDKEVNADDVFVVKYGNTSLIYQKDFEVEYQNHNQAGKATLVIKGKGSYCGSKTINYILTGKAFNTKNVIIEGVKSRTYTGKPITQNGVKVIYKDGSNDGLLLEYGKDYTISYIKHINKGTATMTFKAKGDSGYVGSIKKTFKIEAADINNVIQKDMENIAVEYSKSGAKPVEEIQLVNKNGIELVNGKDYTLTYKNNKNIANKRDENAPVIIVKGKGNYGGEPLEIPFTIKKAVLHNNNIKIDVKEIAYNATKAADYQYKPAVKIYYEGKALSVNKDYTIEYKNYTQEAYEAYYISKTSGEEQRPKVVIRGVKDSNYEVVEEIEASLPIYQTKLSSGNIYVICENGEYTGKQVGTVTAVYYTEDKELMKKAKQLADEEDILKLGLMKLNENSDYTISYGKNIVAGKNKGTVTMKGQVPLYGGSVNVKFTINNKKIEW